MLNVLSVDWDYFMDCNSDTIAYQFPDGGNESIGLSLSNSIWATKYADSERVARNTGVQDLLAVRIREYEFNHVSFNILSRMTSNTHICFAESHSEIYELVAFNAHLTGSKANVYNIDRHSDAYNMGDGLNCGNWVNYLQKNNHLGYYTWINNDASAPYMDILNPEQCCKVTDDITVIDEVDKWDIVFICRSSIWTPPHLDCEFNRFYNLFANNGIYFDKAFYIDRYATIKDEIKEMRHIFNDTNI